MFRSTVVVLVVCLVAVGCSGDGEAGPVLDGARTFYESLDLSSPVAAVETFTDAFARDDFMTVWLVLDPEAQFAFQQYFNLIEYDGLIRVDAVEGDLGMLLQEAWAVDNPDRSIDAWYLFDQVMLIADRHDAFWIDLSGEVVFGVAEPGDGYSDVPAEVEGIDGEVMFRVTGSEGGRWRVRHVILPGGDEQRIPWSVPSAATGGEPSWCVSAGGLGDAPGPAVTGLADRLGDPRADDPGWVYLESLGDAVAVPGPEVDAALLDPEAVRGFQRIGLDGREGTVGVLVAGEGLGYRVAAPDYEGSVLPLVLIETELCLGDGRITSTFILFPTEITGVLDSVTIEASIGGVVVGRTDPLTFQVAEG